jgi:cytochrome c-type biogenesis protein CcmH
MRASLRARLAAALVALALAVGALAPAPALAVQPDEMLDDPALEARARELTINLRCLVCRNESVDESNADFAREVRLIVRERLVAGDTDAEVIDFMVQRYGEYILLRPVADGVNLILWVAAPGMFLLALGTSFVYLRRRRITTEALPKALSEAEKARLKELMGD